MKEKMPGASSKNGLAFNIRQPYLESIPIFSSYLCK